MARDGRRTAALMAVQPVATDADATHWGGSSGRRRWRYSHWIEAPVLWGSSLEEEHGREDREQGEERLTELGEPAHPSVLLAGLARRDVLALTGTSPVSDLGVCFLDLADLSAEERFKVDFLELRDAKLQAVAVAKLHSACQQRWSTEQLPLVPTKQAFFLDYTMDAQARRLYEHIAAAAGMGTATSPAFSGAGRSAPRDAGLAEEKRSSGTPSRTSKEAFRSGEMRRIRDPAQTELEPDAQSGLLGDLWGFLTLAGCAPERCAPKRCGCQWEDGAILPMQRPEAPRPGACSEDRTWREGRPEAFGVRRDRKWASNGLGADQFPSAAAHRGTRCRSLCSVAEEDGSLIGPRTFGLTERLVGQRYSKFTSQPSKAACLAFDGPAFRGLRASMFSKAEQKQAQTSLRILCALYGVLKPYDGIRPYRLEMASKFQMCRHQDLKAGKIKYLVNCASQEFWKSIQPKKLPPGVRVVTCEFSGPSSLVKQARGSMCRFIVTKRIKDPAGLKKFTGEEEGGDDKNRWSFQVGRSSESKLVFAPGKKRAAEDAKASSKRAKRAKRSSVASSPPRSTPHVPSFRPEELIDAHQSEDTIRRKLFQTYEEPPPTVRAPPWRSTLTSSCRGEEDGTNPEALGHITQELQQAKAQLEEETGFGFLGRRIVRWERVFPSLGIDQERCISRNLVAERKNLHSQVCKAQSDYQALSQKHQNTLLGLEQMCIQLGEAKKKEDRPFSLPAAGEPSASRVDLEEQAKCMEASLRTLQAVSAKLGDAGHHESLEALRCGLTSVLSEYKPADKAFTPRGKRTTSSRVQETPEARQILAKPHFDGQYLSAAKLPVEGTSTPSARAEGEGEATGDLLPPPPSSKCWEWPLSKPEKQERVAMIDAQLWRYEQTGLIEQVEMLQGLCAQHGVAIAPGFEDEIVSTASSESV
eukprot:g26340.t1